MKVLIKISCFVILLLFISSCNKYEPLVPKSSVDTSTQVKSGFNADDQIDKQITDPENEDDIDTSITDPENEEDKEPN